MALQTSDQMVANYQAAMASPTTQSKYKAGIQAFNGNPMALAASPQAMQAYSDGVMLSITSGKRVASLNAANPADWKNNAVTIGAPNLASGARKAGPKLKRFYDKAIPVYAQMKQAALNAGPGGGLAGAQARANAALAVLMQAFGKA